MIIVLFMAVSFVLDVSVISFKMCLFLPPIVSGLVVMDL